MSMNLFVLIVWLAAPATHAYNPVVLGRYATLQQCNAAAKQIPHDEVYRGHFKCLPYYPDGSLPK